VSPTLRRHDVAATASDIDRGCRCGNRLQNAWWNDRIAAMDMAFWLAVIKVLHIAALVVWLGPSAGTWLALMLARHRFGEPGVETLYLYRGFLQVLWLEHLGLLLMLGTGALLLGAYGLPALEWPWLRLKLLLVVTVIVPLELTDMWFSHRRLPEIFAAREPDAPYTTKEQRILHLYHRRFVPIALPTLLATVATMMWLAVAKPG
jgi:hypothetical protein